MPLSAQLGKSCSGLRRDRALVNRKAAINYAALRLIFSNSLIFLPVDPQQWDDIRTVLGDRGQIALTSTHFPCHRS